MTDDDMALVKRLREGVLYGDARLHNPKGHDPLHMEAADRIETLSAENERLLDIDEVKAKVIDSLLNDLASAEQANERLRMALGRKSMTSEPRPAVQVWWDAYEEFMDPPPDVMSFSEAAAAVIEADREAIRAEQAAELAKFKALAETLAGALATAASCLNQCAEGLATQNDMETWAEDATQTLRQYKEARDV